MATQKVLTGTPEQSRSPAAYSVSTADPEETRPREDIQSTVIAEPIGLWVSDIAEELENKKEPLRLTHFPML